MALGFAVGTRGADHNRSGAYQVDFSPTADRLQVDAAAVARAIEFEDEAALFDSLILCKFLRGVFADKLSEISQMLQLVTGWDVTPEELTATARRIVTARKQFNISAGWTPAEDTLPARFFQEQLPTGASAGAQLNAARLEQLKRVYYSLRGWDARGYPATAEEP
jgi:aldehyde:ferredoxin oxidoreductase